jgi:hypothetical protein
VLCTIDFSEGSTMDSGHSSYLKLLNSVVAIGHQPCADLRMLDVLDIQLYTSSAPIKHILPVTKIGEIA